MKTKIILYLFYCKIEEFFFILLKYRGKIHVKFGEKKSTYYLLFNEEIIGIFFFTKMYNNDTSKLVIFQNESRIFLINLLTLN